MKTPFFAIALVSFNALLAGCSGATDRSTDTTSPDESALSSASSEQKKAFDGTWNLTSGESLFYAYTFAADGTYSALGGCKPGGDGPHCFAIISQKGTWKISKSGPQLGAPGGAAELVLKDQLGQTDTFFFSMKDDTLTMSTEYRGPEMTFAHDVSTMRTLESGDVCADKNGNSLGQCGDGLACQADDPAGKVQRCL